MNWNTNSVIAVCVGLGGAVLLTFLLRIGDIGSLAFTVAFSVTLFLSYVLHRGRSVTEVDFRNLRVTLQQIEQAKTDIYAKVETVRRLGEQIAELAAWNVRTVNRILDESHLQHQMLAARDQIAAMLEDLGSDKARIAGIIESIDKTIEHDLKGEIISAIIREMNTTRRTDPAIDTKSVLEETKPLIRQYDRDKLSGVLKRLQLHTPDVERRMDQYERFAREKRL